MSFRPTRALLFLATVALLLLAPNGLIAWNAPPAASDGPAAWPEPAADEGGLESPGALAPDDEPLGDPPPPPPPSNKPPVIKNFTHTVAGTLVTFTGQVVDENPAGLTVRFGGPSAMGNATTVTDANGNFTLIVNMGGQTGEVWSRTTDGQGLESAYAYTNVY
jgi:hypothetical protein